MHNPIKTAYGANLLRARGVADVELFLHPTPDCLQSCWDLENCKKGVQLISLTLNDPRPYAIIADCDMDGVASFAIMYQYIKKLNPNKEIQFFIHSGKQHGFSDLMDELLGVDWSLIIAPDSGSNDGNYIEQFSCPVLVLDHHIKEENTLVPLNMILINNQTSPKYHNKDLCGGGVTWQFCRALDEAFGVNYAQEYIDLAALSIIGDMMSLLSYENQFIIQEGLNNIKNVMFQTLIEKQSFSIGNGLTPIKVAFYIVPLVNAMIRVGTQDEKRRLYLSFIEPYTMVDCFKRGAKGTKTQVCIESTRECTNAKAHQDRDKQKFVDCLEAKLFKHDLLENQILFLRLEDEDDFPPELNGLAAMVIASKYHKPTIVARLNDEGYDRGSARAPSNIELTSFKEYLANTGLFEYTLGR